MKREQINILMDEFKNKGGEIRKNLRIEMPKPKLTATAFKSRLLSEETIARLLKLHSCGVKQYKISEELKISKSTIGRILKARGLT